MTRGILTGEIIDKLSDLNNQVNFRGSLQLYDINKVSEDFFCKLLNIIYGYRLNNLNAERSNIAGIDLGDETNKIAFQITSQSDSSKVNDTLRKISNANFSKYPEIKIFIIGQKQNSYTAIDPDLIEKFQFTKENKQTPEDFIEYNIVDTKQLLKDIVVLDIKVINQIYEFIKSEMQSVIIDLEVARPDGTFPTTILGRVEQKSTSKSENGQKVLANAEVDELDIEKINQFFNKLNTAPRISREMYYYIVNHGTPEDDTISVFFDETVRTSGISQSKITAEMKILARKDLVFELDFDDVDTDPKLTLKLGEEINQMLIYVKENLDLYKFIVQLDFTIIDE